MSKKLVLCSRCCGNAQKHASPFWGACYLCGGMQRIPEELAAAYTLFSSGLDRRPRQAEVARLRREVAGWDDE